MFDYVKDDTILDKNKFKFNLRKLRIMMDIKITANCVQKWH